MRHQRPVNVMNYLLLHPRVLHQKNQRYVSKWKTGQDLEIPREEVVVGTDEAVDCTASIILRLLLRGIFAIAGNLCIREAKPHGQVLRIDLACSSADNRHLVVVVVCSKRTSLNACKKHGHKLVRALRGIVPRGVCVRAHVAMVENGRTRMLRA